MKKRLKMKNGLEIGLKTTMQKQKFVSVHAKTQFSDIKRRFFAKQNKIWLFWSSWWSFLSQKRHFFPVNAYKNL